MSFVYCSRSAYQRAETGTVKTPFDAETGQPPTVRFIVSVSTANVRRNNVSSRGVPAQSAAGSEVDPSRFVSTSNARATESASHDRRVKRVPDAEQSLPRHLVHGASRSVRPIRMSRRIIVTTQPPQRKFRLSCARGRG